MPLFTSPDTTASELLESVCISRGVRKSRVQLLWSGEALPPAATVGELGAQTELQFVLKVCRPSRGTGCCGPPAPNAPETLL